MEQEQKQFESGLTDAEQLLDASLSQALKVDIPAGIAARVWQASCDSLGSSPLESKLDQAYEQPTPTELPQRIFEASLLELQHGDEPSIIGRVSVVGRLQQVAIAAGLLLTTLIAIRFGLPQQPEPPTSSHLSTLELSVEEEGLMLDDFELSEYTYLADTRELAFADVEDSFNSVRQDIELWQYGLLTE